MEALPPRGESPRPGRKPPAQAGRPSAQMEGPDPGGRLLSPDERPPLHAQAGIPSPRREAQPRRKAPRSYRRPIPDGRHQPKQEALSPNGIPSAQTGGLQPSRKVPSPDGTQTGGLNPNWNFLRPDGRPSVQTGASVTECVTNHEYCSDKMRRQGYFWAK